MIRRVLIAVVALILLALPKNASATELPIATWDAQGRTVTVSGSCDAETNLLLIYLYSDSGPSYEAGCVEAGQGGHFSATFFSTDFPSPSPDYPDALKAGDALVVWDFFAPEGPVTIKVPDYVPPPSVPVPALGSLAILAVLAAALLILGGGRLALGRGYVKVLHD